MCTVINKKKQEWVQPLSVIQYNVHMKSVDRSDLMLAYYSCER